MTAPLHETNPAGTPEGTEPPAHTTPTHDTPLARQVDATPPTTAEQATTPDTTETDLSA